MEYIYKILNTINGKFYIGRTIHPNVRKRQHFSMLRKNIHHCIKLQNAYNKYNKEDFIFIIIETCFNSEKREQELLDIINYKDSYNISKSSLGGGIKENNPNWKGGVTFCKCGNRISSVSKTCMRCKDITGKNNPFYGKTHSNEFKQKMSNNMKGNYKGNQEKPVIIENVEYNSVSLASKALNVCPATIIYRIKSNNIKFKNYFYKINA